ncbi:hypothetical protein O1611_g6505 [Lasiodiplodia mahajangana]|uniref:Uncharacterized protein n=1 Tax=Lasiodiplodia mahajangana TaxID=1108764 RepID=A0ACC2JI11_9PEZI|nr:hypothetical protein O1611_g6505 [Lasiodiplodia mahajangana]
MIWSPWVHVTPRAGADYEACRNSATDCLIPALLQWGAEAYYPERQPTAEEVAYMSPLHHPFRTRVPLFIHAGTTEAFFDAIEEFATEMAKINGNRIRFHRTEFGTHDLILTYDGVGLEAKVESALRDASGFFEQ